MSMFKIDELSGSLIRSGRFTDAINKFGQELRHALSHGVVTQDEVFGVNGIIARFNRILLNPAREAEVEKLAQDMLFIAIRIPSYVRKA